MTQSAAAQAARPAAAARGRLRNVVTATGRASSHPVRRYQMTARAAV